MRRVPNHSGGLRAWGGAAVSPAGGPTTTLDPRGPLGCATLWLQMGDWNWGAWSVSPELELVARLTVPGVPQGPGGGSSFTGQPSCHGGAPGLGDRNARVRGWREHKPPQGDSSFAGARGPPVQPLGPCSLAEAELGTTASQEGGPWYRRGRVTGGHSTEGAV